MRVWAVQDVTHTKISALVCSCEGSTPCQSEFTKVEHAKDADCVANGSKYFIRSFAHWIPYEQHATFKVISQVIARIWSFRSSTMTGDFVMWRLLCLSHDLWLQFAIGLCNKTTWLGLRKNNIIIVSYVLHMTYVTYVWRSSRIDKLILSLILRKLDDSQTCLKNTVLISAFGPCSSHKSSHNFKSPSS